MDNQWKKVELYGANNDGNPIRFTIADATTVSRGDLLALTDPRTVTASAIGTIAFAGVAAEDHVANQGITSISVWTDGIFEALCSFAIGIGAPLTGTSNNCVMSAVIPATASGAGVIGHALEAGTATTETINVRLRL